jgi:hypothetical protein
MSNDLPSSQYIRLASVWKMVKLKEKKYTDDSAKKRFRSAVELL